MFFIRVSHDFSNFSIPACQKLTFGDTQTFNEPASYSSVGGFEKIYTYTIYIYINTKVSSRRPKLASHLKPPGSFLDLTALFLSLNVCRFCLLVLYFGGTVVPGEVFLLLLLIHLHSSCTHLFTALITCTRLQRTEASAPEYRRSPPRCYGSSEIS